jgi:hypothetical protein
MDEVDGLDLTERLVSPSEMAQIMGVDEADVLAWIERGDLDVQRGEDGEPSVPIREHREFGRSADGAAGFEAGLTVYSGPRDRQLLADARTERRARERDAEIAAAAATGVDIDALTAALALRLAAVAPPEVRIATTARGMVDVLGVRGGGAGVDVLLAVSGYESDSRSPADRVVDAGWRLLETAQDAIAEVTADPWPQHGSGTLPEPRAQLSQDGATVRLFYGAEDNPTLELAALSIIDVLSP